MELLTLYSNAIFRQTQIYLINQSRISSSRRAREPISRTLTLAP